MKKDDVRIRDLSEQTYYNRDIKDITIKMAEFSNIIKDSGEAMRAIFYIKRIDIKRKDVMVALNWMLNEKPKMFINYEGIQCTLRNLYTELIMVNGMDNNKYFDQLPLYLKTWILDKLLFNYSICSNRDSEFYGKTISTILRRYFVDADVMQSNFDIERMNMSTRYVLSIYCILNYDYKYEDGIDIQYNLYQFRFKHNMLLKKTYIAYAHGDKAYGYITNKLKYKWYKFKTRKK